MKAELLKRVDSDFSYRAPAANQDKLDLYEIVRAQGKGFARILVGQLAEGRELSLALTKIEEAVMWANASLIREEQETVSENGVSETIQLTSAAELLAEEEGNV